MQHVYGLKPEVLSTLQDAFNNDDDVMFDAICDSNNIDEDVVDVLCRDFLPQGCFTPNSPWARGADISWPLGH